MSFFVQRFDDIATKDNFETPELRQTSCKNPTRRTVVKAQAVELKYIAKFKVLLCTTCQYCVLPQAIDRHLKRIHHLPWSERQCLTEQVDHLDLAAWDNVYHPSPDHPPIAGLPCFDGYACTVEACAYMCVTTKRMLAHRRDAHSRVVEGPNTQDVQYRSTKLQTFFRGNNLRYFEVADRGPLDSATFVTGTVMSSTMPLLRNLPPASDDKETLTDWMLTKNFCEHDYQSFIPVKGTQSSWRDRMVQAGISADYLRYAMLSLTASRIAFKYSGSRQRYHLEADRYRHMAIQTFPVNGAEVTCHTFYEIFNFSRLMTMCYIAKAQSDNPKTSSVVDDHVTLSQPVLPEWVLVQRQGRALTWPFRGQGRVTSALHGPAQRLLAVYALPELAAAFWPHEKRLDELKAALKGLKDILVNPACFEALDLLRKAWTIPHQETIVGFRDMALMWTVRVSDRFINLVQSHDPAALIVFAHFCVMWTFAEKPYWYMEGHAESILLRIIRHLDIEWHAWILWPIDVVLIDHNFPI